MQAIYFVQQMCTVHDVYKIQCIYWKIVNPGHLLCINVYFFIIIYKQYVKTVELNKLNNRKFEVK